MDERTSRGYFNELSKEDAYLQCHFVSLRHTPGGVEDFFIVSVQLHRSINAPLPN